MSSVRAIEDPDLPHGWMKLHDASSGRTYYWNKLGGGETTYERPVASHSTQVGTRGLLLGRVKAAGGCAPVWRAPSSDRGSLFGAATLRIDCGCLLVVPRASLLMAATRSRAAHLARARCGAARA